MTKRDIIEYACSLPQASADCPFTGDFDTTVLRHTGTRKWFGIILAVPASHYGRAEEALNLKCPPDLIPLLTEKYAGYVYPAYHMNRTHWVTVRLTADDGLIRDLLRLSHTLTGPRTGKSYEQKTQGDDRRCRKK